MYTVFAYHFCFGRIQAINVLWTIFLLYLLLRKWWFTLLHQNIVLTEKNPFPAFVHRLRFHSFIKHTETYVARRQQYRHFVSDFFFAPVNAADVRWFYMQKIFIVNLYVSANKMTHLKHWYGKNKKIWTPPVFETRS